MLKKLPEVIITPNEMREIREGLGMTRDGFSGLLGVTPRAIEHWEYGRRKIPTSVVLLLIYVLGKHFPEYDRLRASIKHFSHLVAKRVETLLAE